ncbi:HlyD family secretion protein [Fusibacter ferrireducens]|uniref:HlyD family efflux transporter periplasmic adaptor subunit n=1 Tax=Fusibacter ferrireducens TaxID=2785058 RepID=A0ABR9ZTX6_9FIRM|nr:HlyD family efflux transporter periplasmic adaptor subunit [Fusibacter ferrireducens]MBF4693801.1 HlyD family efflux transporter periplasmic adaptor subunit [Fusibacter ferrireducens]
MKKRIFIGMVVVILGSVWFYTSTGESDLEPIYTGFIERNITKAMSQTSGKIMEIEVKEGQTVAKGDLIAVVDDSELVFQRDKIVSEIAMKQNKLDLLIEGADANEFEQLMIQQESLKLKIGLATDDLKIKQEALEDAKKLLENNAISTDQVDQLNLSYQRALTDLNILKKEYEKVNLTYDDLLAGTNLHTIEIAKSDLKLSEISLQSIEKKIEETRILAPSNGIVRHMYFNENEILSTGTVLADLLEEDSLYVQFYVSEADFSRIELGEQIKLTLDGSGETVGAQITEISNYAQFTPKNISTKADRQSLVFKVKANLEERAELHSGMMVDVELEAGVIE